MPESITRVESTGFYAGQNRWVAIAVKVIVVSLVLWASLASNAGDILMNIQSGTIGHFRGWYVYASATFMQGESPIPEDSVYSSLLFKLFLGNN